MFRRRRGWFLTAVAMGLAAIVAGAIVAFIGYRETSGPEGAVKGYFAALERSDAATALAFGDIPDGPRIMLTSKVLREQQRIAPISDLQVTDVQRSGSRASVTVRYNLAFADDRLTVDDSVDVVHRGATWHLTRVAAYTRLDVVEAADRASIVGAAVPAAAVLVFPGAAPIRLDTPSLTVEPDSSVITLSGSADTTIGVSISPAGRSSVRAALAEQLRSCLTNGGHADPRCPLPTSRSVPGTVQAALPATAVNAISVVVQPEPSGVLQLSGSLRLTGSYTALDFNNIAHVHRGAFTLPVHALAYPANPVVISWQQATT